MNSGTLLFIQINKKTKAFALSLLLAAVMTAQTASVRGAVASNPSESALLRKSYYSKFIGTEREYWLYLPTGYNDDTQKRWPVIMFLHGRGQRFGDLDGVLKNGPIMEAAVKKRDLPFIIIAPQLHNVPQPPRGEKPKPKKQRVPMVRKSTGGEPNWGRFGPMRGWYELENDLLLILDQTLNEYRADPDSVYLTGLSFGGFGTWYMATNYPERWAAVAPICGAGNPDEVHKIGKLPVWLFQGGRDPRVLPEWSIATAEALDKAGGNVRVTVHEDLAHNCWIRVYAGEDLYKWFLSHKRDKTNTRTPDVVFVPTPQDVVDRMLELAEVKQDDLVYDLGCGDGRVVVTAAKRYGCRAIGYDIDPLRVKESLENVEENNVGHLVKIEQKDIFTLDLSKANVIALYLLADLNVKLIPQLEKLRPGSRIVSHDYGMEGIRPDKVVRLASNEDCGEHKISVDLTAQEDTGKEAGSWYE